MSTQSEIRECHQLMAKEIRAFPSGAMGPAQLDQLYALSARMQRLCAEEASNLACDRDMRALHMNEQALEWTLKALPQ